MSDGQRTDEQMDARLRAAGETWRATAGAATDPPLAADATHDLETLDIRPRQRRHVGLLASAAVVAAALVIGGAFLIGNGGGKHHQGADAAGLEGTVWRLVAVGGRGEQTNSFSTMYIGKDGTVVADDSCSVVSAHLDVRDGHLYPTGNFDIRYHDCTDSVGELTFGDGFELLTHFPSYELTGDGLTLSAAGQSAMRFTAAPELVPPTIDVPLFLGATWRLTKVVDGQQVEHPVSGTPTLRVSNGRLTASDGCNTIGAAAAVTGQQVDLKNVATTAIGCTGEVSTTAAAIDAFFTADGLHEQIEGTTLTIKGGGVGYLTYQWQPDDPQATDPANLIGKPWHLESVAGEPAAAKPVDLRIGPDGSFLSSDGCNGLSGTAEVGIGTLTVTEDAHAQANCVHAETIRSFLDQKPALWAIRDGKLLIYGGGAQAFALVYSAGAPSSKTPATEGPLAGKTWKLVGVEVSSGGTSSGEGSSGSDITLNFDGFGGVKLDPGCGEYTGAYVIAADTIAFAALADHSGTRCAVNSQRTAHVVSMLDGPVKWKVDKGQLILTKGNTTLTFDP